MDRLAGRLVRRFRDDADEPTVAGLEDEDADKLFDALGSKTSRAILAACYEQGRTRSELADDLETSIQNVSYHVDKLESADLLEAVETRYGQNGREVTVYEPSKRAVVVAAGEPGVVDRLADAVDRLFAPITFVGLLAMTVAAIVRGPARVGMLGDDAGTATTAPTAPEPWLVAAVLAALCGTLIVFVADRLGAFERDGAVGAARTGVPRRLFGRHVGSSRRYAVWIVAFAFATFLALDLVAVGAGHRLTVLAWLAVQLAIPAGLVGAAAVAYLNDGLVASWAAASAPFAGLWGYLVAGDIVRGGFEPILLALGPVAVLVVATPLGTLSYLAGRLLATRRERGVDLSRRAAGALVAHPIAVVALIVSWVVVVR
ncbi:ArsR family transcriptional regulator [Natrarchaeobius halalkaliphilus]|uniref:ArsR family transcriptional regulator n=1 Tax=Natrarchaeobius halalkaliphilus TaxID=1679091 RepID=A0A3N6N4P1_9EURY|nr:helix-turn-helix domain-containing protein [Natrarchaeobius halalkaliphilus]RQG93152.1 ArsR family transcriptional regulator [Natrarchaeobius halalkaliphilus]